MNPKVTVVVLHHLNRNDEYLKNCVYSINQSENVDIELICISDAEIAPTWVDCRLIHDPALNNATKKWHHGVKLSSPHSKYVMLISDDVMVTKHTIAAMAMTAEANAPMIMNPASNCDATTRYYANFKVIDKVIPQKCTLEDIRGYEKLVSDIPPSQPILLPQPWIAFYCTLFPKTVLQAVGDFDEKLDVRGNDVDYCHRAAKLGIPAMIHLGVFALHFGDRTLPHCTTKEEYDSASKCFQEKYHYPAISPEETGDML